jgi:hypothetical protein
MLLACFLVPPKAKQECFRWSEPARLNRLLLLQSRALEDRLTTSGFVKALRKKHTRSSGGKEDREDAEGATDLFEVMGWMFRTKRS